MPLACTSRNSKRRFDPTTEIHPFPLVSRHYRRPRRKEPIRGPIYALTTTESLVVPVESVPQLEPEHVA
jgi:hypothetical protein